MATWLLCSCSACICCHVKPPRLCANYVLTYARACSVHSTIPGGETMATLKQAPRWWYLAGLVALVALAPCHAQPPPCPAGPTTDISCCAGHLQIGNVTEIPGGHHDENPLYNCDSRKWTFYARLAAVLRVSQEGKVIVGVPPLASTSGRQRRANLSRPWRCDKAASIVLVAASRWACLATFLIQRCPFLYLY